MKLSYEMAPTEWVYVIAEARISKLFTVVEAEQPHFRGLKLLKVQ